MMNLLQMGATVGALSAAWQIGAIGETGAGEKEGIKKFAGFLNVRLSFKLQTRDLPAQAQEL